MAEREVVRPRLLRSWGLWAPVAVAASSGLRLAFVEDSALVAIDWVLMIIAAAILLMTLYGGVEVGPGGIRTRRVTRDRREARWDEIVRFHGVPREPVRVRLVDGTDMRLFDYAGDNAQVVDALEDARDRFTDA